MDPGMSTKEFLATLADNAWIVAFAYLAVFLPWSAAPSYDFIGEKWKTVRTTRRRGCIHALIAAVPVLYILVYIVIQGLAGDFKEMSAAIVAMCFSLFHLARTTWGLWQLTAFERWAAKSIETMESLGFEWRFSCSNDGCIDPESSSCGRVRCLRCQKGERIASSRISNIVDNIVVNNTIVDNEIFDGPAQCYLKIGPRSFMNTSGNANIFQIVGYILKVYCSWIIVTWVMPLLWLLEKCVPYLKRKPLSRHIRQVPRFPEELWLHWAAACVAQGWNHWLEVSKSALEPQKVEPVSKWQQDRDFFAAEVWANANYHSRNEQSYGDMTCLMPLEHRLLYKHGGILRKSELLDHALRDGRGLPFGAPHLQAAEGSGYKCFSAMLKKYAESLPAEFGEKIQSLNVEHVESLAIVLSVDRWGVSSCTKSCGAEDCGNMLDDEALPVTILRDQLGFRNGANWWRRRSSFGQLKNEYGNCMRQSSNMLEASVYVDNWLSLCAGDQTQLALDCWHAAHTSSTITGDTNSNHSSVSKDVADSSSFVKTCFSKGQEVVSDIFNTNAEIEIYRMRCQLFTPQPEYAHMEQTMTFLGCNMEILRTKLAKKVVHQKQSLTTSLPQVGALWKPRLPFIPGADENLSQHGILVKASNDLSELIRKDETGSVLKLQCIQIQVIWELQCALLNNYLGSEADPSSEAAMIMCILSFPSLRFLVLQKTRAKNQAEPGGGQQDAFQGNNDFSTVRISDENTSEGENSPDEIRAAFRPVCAPQKLEVLVVFTLRPLEKGQIVHMQVRLAKSDGVAFNDTVFAWEDWRNAFCGRLKGAREWQESHGLATMELVTTKRAMDETFSSSENRVGANGRIWLGWPPFRTRICILELESACFTIAPDAQPHLQGGNEDEGQSVLNLNPLAITVRCSKRPSINIKPEDDSRVNGGVLQYQIAPSLLLHVIHSLEKSNEITAYPLTGYCEEALCVTLSHGQTLRQAASKTCLQKQGWFDTVAELIAPLKNEADRFVTVDSFYAGRLFGGIALLLCDVDSLRKAVSQLLARGEGAVNVRRALCLVESFYNHDAFEPLHGNTYRKNAAKALQVLEGIANLFIHMQKTAPGNPIILIAYVKFLRRANRLTSLRPNEQVTRMLEWIVITERDKYALIQLNEHLRETEPSSPFAQWLANRHAYFRVNPD